MENMKSYLFSERGIKLVNALFCLALLFRSSKIILLAYTVWLVYLIYGIRITRSKTVKVILTLFALFAAAMLAVSGFSLASGL